MSATAEKSSAAAAKQTLNVNQMMVLGRVERITRFDGRVDHIVITPAPDQYSKPSTMRINSREKLADIGEDVKVLCVFNGWPNNYEMRDKDGEKRKVYEARGYFVAVE